MSKTLRSRRPFGDLFRRLQANPADRLALQQAAQLALQVEFATIPVYLSGLYSIQDRDCVAYQALRSVVMEEMVHINQAANLVVALGALPRFTGQAAPEYPCYLPHANEATTPLLGLYRASPAVFENVFAAIETPAPAGAPPQADHYDTIAQLYEALSDAIQRHPGNPFEPPAREGRQRLDIYIGKFGGKTLPIIDKPSARFAIQQIVQQGEGSVPAGSPMNPAEPFGAYNHYGRRTDGTYGPIIGLPAEMSHFSKFRHVALDKENFPPTLPVTSNPDAADFSNPEARELAAVFNQHYSVMLHALEVSFQAGPSDPYFSIVLNLMHHVLPQLATSLMNTPAHLNGDSSVGPNAAPTWHYEPQARLAALAPTLRATLNRRALPRQALQPLAAALQGLERLAPAAVSTTPL